MCNRRRIRGKKEREEKAKVSKEEYKAEIGDCEEVVRESHKEEK